jgi:hypothetical protein
MGVGPNILWNAEPFGFGPAAAIAKIAGRCRSQINKSTYLGDLHTLDLQTPAIYDTIIDCASLNDLDQWLAVAASEYDVFVTAMDFKLAERARAARLPVIVYDALAWYWPDLSQLAAVADLYLVQDFIGVKKRLANTRLPPTLVVAPLVSGNVSTPGAGARPRPRPLASFGGIANPIWDEDAGDTYVTVMARALAAIPNLQVIGARRYAPLCLAAGIANYTTASPSESEALFAAASVIAATPGLGNLYGAAAADKPFIPLPPVNDSQGQQLHLLTQAGYLTSALDWHQILGTPAIDYTAPQTTVLTAIARSCHLLEVDKDSQTQLACELELRFARAADGRARLRPLVDDYGCDGDVECAAHILAFADK